MKTFHLHSRSEFKAQQPLGDKSQWWNMALIVETNFNCCASDHQGVISMRCFPRLNPFIKYKRTVNSTWGLKKKKKKHTDAINLLTKQPHPPVFEPHMKSTDCAPLATPHRNYTAIETQLITVRLRGSSQRRAPTSGANRRGVCRTLCDTHCHPRPNANVFP